MLGLPALIVRVGGIELGTEAEVAVFGLGILSAAFLISTGAEAAQHDIPAALSVAVVAFIAVLPEYAVDLLLAFEAGEQFAEEQATGIAAACGGEGQDECKGTLALANMTGANRLLLGIGWATVILLAAVRVVPARRLAAATLRGTWRAFRRSMGIRSETAPAGRDEPLLTLPEGVGLDIGILAIATLYSFIIAAKGRLVLEDTVVLGLLFLWYVVRLTRSPVEEPELEGPAAKLGALPQRTRRIAVSLVIAWSAAIIALSAEPFVHGLEEVGRDIGIGEFFVIQWIAPLASESPEFFAALYLVWRSSPGLGLNMLISSKVNQWTLLIASIPIAFLAGGGGITGLIFDPDGPQRAEIFITAAQSAFGVMLIIDKRLSVHAALGLLGLFLAQLITQFFFQDDNTPRYVFGAIYLFAAAGMARQHWRAFAPILGEAIGNPPRPSLAMVDGHEPEPRHD